MSCEHAETTTLLWLYGEADAAHAEHVAACAECAEVARLHADVVSVTAGHVELPVAAPRPANGVPWAWVSALALAAAVLFAVMPRTEPTAPVDTGERVAAAPAEVALPFDDLGTELEALDAELDDLSLDLTAL